MTKLDLKVVDDQFIAQPGATKQDQAVGQLAAAIREGIRRQKARAANERSELLAAHAGEISGIKQAHQDEMARIAARERAIGHHRAAWLYAIPALVVGATIAMLGMIQMQNYTAATLARNFREQAMTGAIIQANQEPARCIPGETLADGRVCPQIPSN